MDDEDEDAGDEVSEDDAAEDESEESEDAEDEEIGEDEIEDGSDAEAVSEGVARLVAEIDRAVVTIENLKRENVELQQENQTLRGDVSLLEEELVDLRSDRDRLQEIYNDNAPLIDNKPEILNKVEAALESLSALNAERNE